VNDKNLVIHHVIASKDLANNQRAVFEFWWHVNSMQPGEFFVNTYVTRTKQGGGCGFHDFEKAELCYDQTK